MLDKSSLSAMLTVLMTSNTQHILTIFQCKRAAAQCMKDRERAYDVMNTSRDKEKDTPKVFVSHRSRLNVYVSCRFLHFYYISDSMQMSGPSLPSFRRWRIFFPSPANPSYTLPSHYILLLLNSEQRDITFLPGYTLLFHLFIFYKL